MSRSTVLPVMVAGLAVIVFATPARAQLTPDHRRELLQMQRELGRVSSMIRKKEYDEAENVLESASSKIEEIASASNVPVNSPFFRRLTNIIETQQAQLDKAVGMADKDGGVSFALEVAPIIESRCLRCHGENNPRNRLRLDTFAGWRAGGRGGPLLVPGNAGRSLLIARLNAPEGQGRMPAQGDPLSKDEIETISTWINQGAKFDGPNPNMSLADVTYQVEMKTLDIQLPKSTGTETVKFTQDIAPWFANLCLGCHNARRKSGGLSVESFYDIMKGGDSGEVIIPGNMDDSRLFRLVGGLELPRMPQGQARITRQNYEDLKQWFQEGNTFDGQDPRASITTYSPGPAKMELSRFAKMSDSEIQKLRTDQSRQMFREALPGEERREVTSENFLVLGNVDQAQLKEVQDWAQEQLKTLQSTFAISGVPWRGRLAIFALSDRDSFIRFYQEQKSGRPDRDLTGIVQVLPDFEEAYVALPVSGDTGTSNSDLRATIVELVTAAYLQRNGGTLPVWITRGTGLVMALSAQPDPQRDRQLRQTAASLAPAVASPADVFSNGAFSDVSAAAIGYALVQYLKETGGDQRFAQFVVALQGGQNLPDALQGIYGAGTTAVAEGFFAKLKGR